MPIWQPKSVLHLVVTGFLVAVAPLCLAVLYTVQTLGVLSEKNRQVTAEVVAMSRLGQEVQRDLLDLERRARQYLTLKSTGLLELFEQEQAATLNKLTELHVAMGQHEELVSDLFAQVAALDPRSEDEVMQQFAAISGARLQLADWTRQTVDSRVTEHAVEADKVKDSLFFMVFLMALVTLVVMLLFSLLINRPIKRLSREIKQLGDGGLSRPIAIEGLEEVKVLGQQLEWLRQRLNETDQQKQRFLRHVSHELKTPLANLREGTDLLAEQVSGPLSNKQQEIVAIAQQNSIELQRLIENLLDFSQVPEQALVVESIELEPLIDSLLQQYRISIESKKLNLHFDLQQKSWRADRHKLSVALDNLLSNAVNYSPDAGEIEIISCVENDSLVLDAANTGASIPATEASRLFEPFYQGSSERLGPIKGSGIGLSLALECMQAQGGSLSLVKHARLGVCFRLLCPSLDS